jgi:hypothetical protein
MSWGLLSVSDLDTFNIEWIKDEVHLIDRITYEVLKWDWTHLADVTIDKATYNDYFKVGNTYLKVYASNSTSN